MGERSVSASAHMRGSVATGCGLARYSGGAEELSDFTHAGAELGPKYRDGN